MRHGAMAWSMRCLRARSPAAKAGAREGALDRRADGRGHRRDAYASSCRLAASRPAR
ncbi:hypothetical protein RAJCM14343_2159 [Rhodococcus aetherivorans]|uniref:Uncharacterized protein n=1 Tax=Rhodococcus aetherivorans TaxID=191292 RepID=A0ABQ0YKC3_9NOCA|nr:hypothetical protein RAJCM14343_2159 [Rhodococcus aetherivorans]CCW11242.1 hypothetical protein EBESD8_17780 [Rhodococcus aetherivorans]